MPHADSIEADRGFDLNHGVFVAVGGDDVVAGDMGVAGIETDRHRRVGAQKPHEFGDLVEAAAERKLGAGGVFDEDGEAGALPGKAVEGAFDGFGGEPEPLVAAEASP